MLLVTEFFVETKQNDLRMELSCVTKSLYSVNDSALVVPSWQSAFGSISVEYYEEDREEYNPLYDRFPVSDIKVNGLTFLERSGMNSFAYPQKRLDSDVVILHGPNEMNRQHSGHFFLGVICSVHNSPSVVYKWFWNGQVLHKGNKLCVIIVEKPGSYWCQIVYQDIKLTLQQ